VLLRVMVSASWILFGDSVAAVAETEHWVLPPKPVSESL
jgi:hypothetical protein